MALSQPHMALIALISLNTYLNKLPLLATLVRMIAHYYVDDAHYYADLQCCDEKERPTLGSKTYLCLRKQRLMSKVRYNYSKHYNNIIAHFLQKN